MIMGLAGEPEVRCVVCGDRSVDHRPLRYVLRAWIAHRVWNWLAAAEIVVRYRVRRVFG